MLRHLCCDIQRVFALLSRCSEILGILGIIFDSFSTGRAKNGKMAIAGFVLSIISALWEAL